MRPPRVDGVRTKPQATPDVSRLEAKEVEVFYNLHRVRACLDEPIEVFALRVTACW